jgi:hypothetical protein
MVTVTMPVTPKQERNGVPAVPANNSSMAQPSASVEFPIAAAMAAEARLDAPTTGVPPNDPHWEWDAGLAVGEQAGEA